MARTQTAPRSLLMPRSAYRRSLRPRSGSFMTSMAPATTSRIPEGLGGLLATVVAAALVTSAVVFVVWSKMVQVQAGYAIHELQREIVELRQEKSALEVEVSSLRRPDRLARVGRERFGLFPPTAEQVLRLPSAPSASSVRDVARAPGQGSSRAVVEGAR